MDPAHVDTVIGEVADALVQAHEPVPTRRRLTGWSQFSLRAFLVCAFLAPILAWIAFAVIPELARPRASIFLSKSIDNGNPGGRKMLVRFHSRGRGEEYVEHDPFDGKADLIRCGELAFGTRPGCVAPITPAMQERYADVLVAVRQRVDPDALGTWDWRARLRGEKQSPWAPPCDAAFGISRKEEDRLRLQRQDFPPSAIPTGY